MEKSKEKLQAKSFLLYRKENGKKLWENDGKFCNLFENLHLQQKIFPYIGRNSNYKIYVQFSDDVNHGAWFFLYLVELSFSFNKDG